MKFQLLVTALTLSLSLSSLAAETSDPITDARALKAEALRCELAGMTAATPAISATHYDAGLGYAVQGKNVLASLAVLGPVATGLLTDLNQLIARLHVSLAEAYSAQCQYEAAALSINAALVVCPSYAPAITLRARLAPRLVLWPRRPLVIKPRALVIKRGPVIVKPGPKVVKRPRVVKPRRVIKRRKVVIGGPKIRRRRR